MKPIRLFLYAAMALAVIGICIQPLAAQAPTRARSIEVAGFGGFAGNLPTGDFTQGLDIGLRASGISPSRYTINEGSDKKWNVGGAIGVAVNRDVLVVGEIVRNRLANPSVTLRTGSSSETVTVQANLLDATGGLHYQFPVRSSKVVPYAAFGMGIARVSANTQGSLASDVTVSESDLTYNAGGGARVYLSKALGIRPDVRMVRLPGQTYVRTTFALFYQIGNR